MVGKVTSYSRDAPKMTADTEQLLMDLYKCACASFSLLRCCLLVQQPSAGCLRHAAVRQRALPPRGVGVMWCGVAWCAAQAVQRAAGGAARGPTVARLQPPAAGASDRVARACPVAREEGANLHGRISSVQDAPVHAVLELPHLHVRQRHGARCVCAASRPGLRRCTHSREGQAAWRSPGA